MIEEQVYSIHTPSRWEPRESRRSPPILPSSPAIRLTAEDVQVALQHRFSELTAQSTEHVRQALLAQEAYFTEREERLHDYVALLRSRDEILHSPASISYEPNSPLIMGAIEARFGPQHVQVLEVGERILSAAVTMISRIQAVPPRPRFRVRDQRTSSRYNEGLSRLIWSYLALQIAAVEQIPLPESVLEDIEDDLVYLPRQMYLAACAGLHHRKMGQFRWLELACELDEDGLQGPALGLLFDGVGEILADAPDALGDFFDAVSLERASTALVRGILTATAAAQGDERRKAFEDRAQRWLDEQYAHGAGASA